MRQTISNFIYQWFQNASILKICLTVIGLILITWGIFAILLWQWTSQRQNYVQILVTSLACIVAIASLSVAAIGVLVTSRRQRRHETLKAYEAWTDKSIEKFKNIASHINPMDYLTEKRLQLLLNPEQGSKIDLEQHLSCETDIEAKKLLNSLKTILNGMERLAVGVYEGCYDEKTLRRIGGSIFIDVHDRYLIYIEAVQNGHYGTKANPRAYKNLVSLAGELKKFISEENRIGAPRPSPTDHRR